MKRGQPPAIEVQNGQRAISLSTRSLSAFAEIALSLAWPRRRKGSDMRSVSAILVSIVSDKRMAQLHQNFCGIAGPTDVLTFQHGEIVISAETAIRQARTFRSSLGQELRLYILHGLLHLCGYDDKSVLERARIERMQHSLLRKATLAARRQARPPTRVAKCAPAQRQKRAASV
jgi:probable rRNA maturation factor